MGAWGSGAFDNDDASDWLADELETAADMTAIRSALDLSGSDYLEAPSGSIAVAAAEVVAAVFGHPGGPLPTSVQQWVASHQDTAELDDARTAVAAVDRVLADDSELKELWEDSSDTEWLDAMTDLRRRLVVASSGG